MKSQLIAAVLALFAMVAGAGVAHADEGMWTFDNFPSAQVKAKYGVVIDQAWLDKVRASAVRLSTGCSASVVSSQGLALTNHHCVRDCDQALSSASADYVTLGFVAAIQREERLCPGLQAEILTSITDETAKVGSAVTGLTGEAFVKARDRAIATIEKTACQGREAVLRCQVINLYAGGQYKLYTYHRYTDVRLVFSPESQASFFGGDPDNFNFPRYDLDCAFVRLYENGKPVATPAHLRWNPAPPEPGEPVFVAGNPGATQRLLTADELEFLRDVVLPETALQTAERHGRLIGYAEQGPEQARLAEDAIFTIENAVKVYRGQLQALDEPGFIAARREADADVRARVAAKPALAAQIGDPWGEIAKAQTARRALYTPYTLLEVRAAQGSDLYRYARRLLRAAQERAKPNGERLPEYADARLPLMQKQILDNAPVHPQMERLNLQFWLTKLRDSLTADSPATRRFLGQDSPETLARRLAASKLGDPAVRKQLWDGGMAAIEASTDPMIYYVRNTDAMSRDARLKYEQQVAGPMDAADQRIAKARFAVLGAATYPDATFSLRLSYGTVVGWTEDGQPVDPITRISGLWARATGQFPFDLAPKWVAARGKLDDDTAFDFTSDTDTSDGSSGSPVINARGEVIGAAFDGNIHSLGGDFLFDERLNRSVAVSTAAITEALRKVYGDQALLDELMAR